MIIEHENRINTQRKIDFVDICRNIQNVLESIETKKPKVKSCGDRTSEFSRRRSLTSNLAIVIIQDVVIIGYRGREKYFLD